MKKDKVYLSPTPKLTMILQSLTENFNDMRKFYCLFIIIVLLSACLHDNRQKNKTSKPHRALSIYKENKIFPKIFTNDNYLDFQLDSVIVDGNYIGIFADSTVAFTGKFKNNKPEGLFHYYYLNGKIFSTFVYTNGKQDGVYTFWDKSGTMTECGQFIDGKEDGIEYTWWNYNTLRSKTYRRNDKMEGEDTYYYPNGNLQIRSNYSNDKLDGERKEYYQNGKLQSVEYYQKGFEIGIGREYYQNGGLQRVRSYPKNIGPKEQSILKADKYMLRTSFPVGVWLTYDSLHHITSRTYYDENYNLRERKQYYTNGQMQFDTHFRGRVPYMCSRNQGYDVKHGKFEEFFQDGTLKTLGYYNDNERNGEWKAFDNHGKVCNIEYYNKGTLIKSGER